jgi:hypothetical protein
MNLQLCGGKLAVLHFCLQYIQKIYNIYNGVRYSSFVCGIPSSCIFELKVIPGGKKCFKLKLSVTVSGEL